MKLFLLSRKAILLPTLSISLISPHKDKCESSNSHLLEFVAQKLTILSLVYIV